MNPMLLNIEDLSVAFQQTQGTVYAVDRARLRLAAGETVGLVGESGCGKSVMCLSILGLVESLQGRIVSGTIEFEGRNLRDLDAEHLRLIRGREMAMIFQEPMTALNPVLPIGYQVAEPLITHMGLAKAQARKEAADWLERVKIPAAAKRMRDYPHHLSGGMRQRVMIAMAMVCKPKLLVADEPTTALDVTTQAQIMSLMMELKAEFGMGLLLVTHDLGLVAQSAARVVVMYAGQVMEEAPVNDIFDVPFHPYTQALLKSIPQLNKKTARLSEIPGSVALSPGKARCCRFAPRCAHVFGLCRQKIPPLFEIGPEHMSRCWLKAFPEKRGQNE